MSPATAAEIAVRGVAERRRLWPLRDYTRYLHYRIPSTGVSLVTMTIATRRNWLKTMAALGAGSLVDALLPAWAQQPTQDPTAAFRAQIGAVPIKSQPLGEN